MKEKGGSVMEFLQLRYFECVAHYNSVSKAAEKLHISQPALSNSLKRMEAELGRELFERSNKKMTLTEFGSYYLTVAQRILELHNESKLMAAGKKRLNHISVGLYFYDDQFLNAIINYQQLNPDISFDIYCSTLSNAFPVSGYDFIIGKSDCVLPNFHCQPFKRLKSNDYYVVMPRTHYLANKSSICFQDLEGEPLTFLTDESGNYEFIYQHCILHGLIPKVVLSTNSAAVKLLMMRCGTTLGFIPSNWYNEYVCEGNLKVLPLEGHKSDMNPSLFWTDETLESAHKKEFFAYCQRMLLQSGTTPEQYR